MFSVQEIKELIEWVAANRIRGIELERTGFRLKIDGVAPPETAQAAVMAAAAHPTHYAVPPAPVAQSTAAVAVPAPQPAAAAPETEGLHDIPSPIVGTFYRASGPDQEPFVKQGDRVAKGQTLCIIEAMKLMNEIEADESGEIVRIFAQNGQPVEYGEKLFAIRPD